MSIVKIALLCLVQLPLSHCANSVRIRSYFGPYFPAFGVNTEIITPNTDTIYVVSHLQIYLKER